MEANGGRMAEERWRTESACHSGGARMEVRASCLEISFGLETGKYEQK